MLMLQEGPWVHSHIQIWRKLLCVARSYSETNCQLIANQVDMMHCIVMMMYHFRTFCMNKGTGVCAFFGDRE